MGRVVVMRECTGAAAAECRMQREWWSLVGAEVGRGWSGRRPRRGDI